MYNLCPLNLPTHYLVIITSNKLISCGLDPYRALSRGVPRFWRWGSISPVERTKTIILTPTFAHVGVHETEYCTVFVIVIMTSKRLHAANEITQLWSVWLLWRDWNCRTLCTPPAVLWSTRLSVRLSGCKVWALSWTQAQKWDKPDVNCAQKMSTLAINYNTLFKAATWRPFNSCMQAASISLQAYGFSQTMTMVWVWRN